MSYIPSRGLAEFALKVLLGEDRRTAVVRNAMLSGTGCEKRLRAVIFNGLANDRVGRKRIAVQRSRRTQLTEERRVARTTEGPVDILGPASDSTSLIAVEFKAWRAPGLWRGPADEFAALARDVAKLHRIHLARSDVRGVALVVAADQEVCGRLIENSLTKA